MLNDEDVSESISHSALIMKILAGSISFGVLLVFGSYGYTRIEVQAQQEAIYDWRRDHEAVLTKKFEEIKHNQDRLSDMIEERSDVVKEMLQDIMIEQRRSNRENKESRESRESRDYKDYKEYKEFGKQKKEQSFHGH